MLSWVLCLLLLQDNLSAVDILSACNLVNYFGKMILGGSGVGQITLYPILIRKVCQHMLKMVAVELFKSLIGFTAEWLVNL